MIRLLALGLFGAGLATLAPGSGFAAEGGKANLAPTAISRPMPSFPVGEELVYRARVWKGATWLGKDVGDATFKVEQTSLEGRPAWHFDARASGGGFGYQVNTTIDSYLALDTGEPLRYAYAQSGSEVNSKRLDFTGGKIEYWRLKHCAGGDGCGEAAHVDGGKHCPRVKDCALEAHQTWVRRYEHPEQAGAVDMLAAVYLARTLDLSSDEARTIRVVDDDRVYDVDIRFVKREDVKTSAGRFDTSCVALDPKLVSQNPARRAAKGEKFRGLFGMSGTIRIWIDRASGAPVRISGTIPFGIDLNGQVDLVRRNSGKS